MNDLSHIVVAAPLGPCGGPVQQALAADGHEQVSYVSNADAAIALCRYMRVGLLLVSLDDRAGEGLRTVQQLSDQISRGQTEVIVATDGSRPERLAQALALGARDFLRHPIDVAEVSLRVSNCLVTSGLQDELRARNAELQQTIVDRSDELISARREVLGHLAVATEFRDDETASTPSVSAARRGPIAAAFGLTRELARMIGTAAPLHDVGKIGIPDRILLKPGPLTESERALMRSHTQIGAAILSDSQVPELRLAETIGLSHMSAGTGWLSVRAERRVDPDRRPDRGDRRRLRRPRL